MTRPYKKTGKYNGRDKYLSTKAIPEQFVEDNLLSVKPKGENKTVVKVPGEYNLFYWQKNPGFIKTEIPN